MNESEKKPKSTPANFQIILLLFFPILLHCIVLYADVTKVGFILFRKIDIIVLFALCFYMFITMLVIRNKKLSIKYALVVYASLFPILAFEFCISFIKDRSPRVPLPPMKIESTAGNTMPGIQGVVRFSVNKLGVRAPELWPTSRQDRILCIGGSTTECRYVTDEKSWPWLLGTTLSEVLQRPILAANAGRSGHFTLHHLYQLKHYKLADEFGVVIILCGINDVGTLLRNNYEKRATLISKESLTGSSENGVYYHHSYLLQTLKTALSKSSFVVRDKKGKWYNSLRKKRTTLLNKNKITTLPNNLEYALAIYEANLKKIIQHCSQKKQRLIFLTQPTMYKKNMSKKLSNLIWQHTKNGAYTPDTLEKIMNAYNQTLKDLCRNNDVACLDLASLLPKDDRTFYDDCHFNTSGCEQIVKHLQDFLVNKLDIFKH